VAYVKIKSTHDAFIVSQQLLKPVSVTKSRLEALLLGREGAK